MQKVDATAQSKHHATRFMANVVLCSSMGRLLCRGISLHHTKQHNGIDLKKKKKMKRNCVVEESVPGVRACAFKCLYKTVALNAVCDDYYHHRWVGRTLPRLPLRRIPVRVPAPVSLCAYSTLQYSRVYFLFIGSAVTIVTAFGNRRGS